MKTSIDTYTCENCGCTEISDSERDGMDNVQKTWMQLRKLRKYASRHRGELHFCSNYCCINYLSQLTEDI